MFLLVLVHRPAVDPRPVPEPPARACDAAQHQLKWFNDYFGIKYPFGKLDIIGIPDFAAGAMENVGAITFRERALLVDDATASVDQRRNVASVIAHEIAHQWFGDLVTMSWWDDIWLNEGFATWAANKPLAAWRPEWRMDLQVARELQTALALDTLDTTRAIRTHVETPDEINQVFTVVGYGVDDFITGSLLANHPVVVVDGIRSYRNVTAITKQDAFPDRFLKVTKSVCFGDSGGPVFHRGVVVALNTWTFSTRCDGPNLEYRVDSAPAQAFLDANL